MWARQLSAVLLLLTARGRLVIGNELCGCPLLPDANAFSKKQLSLFRGIVRAQELPTYDIHTTLVFSKSIPEAREGDSDSDCQEQVIFSETCR